MTDRALLFLGSLVVMAGAIAAAIWLIASGQVGTFDGNFLLLSSVTVALAFGLYLRYIVKSAMSTPPAKIEKPAASAPAEKRPAPTSEPVAKT